VDEFFLVGGHADFKVSNPFTITPNAPPIVIYKKLQRHLFICYLLIDSPDERHLVF
jgi:hypothetical protein